MHHPPHWLALQCPSADGGAAWLGTWALQFTPRVVWLEEAWLLDVAPTLRLWGGLDRLAQHMPQRLAGHLPGTLRWALGPTALAALARWRAGLWWAAGDGMPPHRQLLGLPLHTLAAARPHAAVLGRLGVRTWGQLASLPRDGVARRWGATLLKALDQALGHVPESHAWLLPQPVFDQTLVWSHHLETADLLMQPASRLLAALHGWLVLRQRAALALRWSWQHDPRRNVPLSGGFELRTAQPTQHPAHWQRLTTEHLRRHTLAAPVVSIRLETLEHVPWGTPSADWVSAVTTPADHPGALGWSALLERLRARLGDAAVTHWQPQSTHVPDAMQVAGAHRSPAGTSDRPPTLADALLPTWLSPTPLPLAMRGHRPCYQGELELLAGPQRLEQAHWPSGTPAMPAHHQDTPDRAPGTSPPVKPLQRDQPEAAQATLRDYFVARSPRAGLLWVFRQQAARQGEAAWFLHGWFA